MLCLRALPGYRLPLAQRPPGRPARGVVRFHKLRPVFFSRILPASSLDHALKETSLKINTEYHLLRFDNTRCLPETGRPLRDPFRSRQRPICQWGQELWVRDEAKF